MPRLTGVQAFVQVAERRSFRGAARALGVTPAAVSKAVSRLEAHLGAQLLERTSRRVSVTPEGTTYFAHCRAALDHLQAGEDELAEARRVARGEVTLSLSRVFLSRVTHGISRLQTRFPGLRLRLSFTDREVREAEAFDIAVRVGPLDDSSFVAHPLRGSRWVTVASPAYLARSPPLERPADLTRHACIQFLRPDGTLAPFAFPGDGPELRSRVVVDDGNGVVAAAVAGVGVAQAFDFMLDDALRTGQLVALFPSVTIPGPPVHALTPRGRRRVPAVRVVLEMLREVL